MKRKIRVQAPPIRSLCASQFPQPTTVKIKHSKLARHLATRREPSGRERTVRTQSLCGRRHVAVILDDAPAIDAWSRFGHQDRQTCIQHLLGDKATTIPVPEMTTSATVSLTM